MVSQILCHSKTRTWTLTGIQLRNIPVFHLITVEWEATLGENRFLLVPLLSLDRQHGDLVLVSHGLLLGFFSKLMLTGNSGSGWLNNAFGSGGFHRAHTSRPVTIRLLVIQACKQLNTMSPSKGASGYHEVHIVLRQIDQLRPSTEPAISLKEMLDICDTEGNPQNGGGSFLIRDDENGHFVKFEPDTNSAASGHRGSSVPGEIGSPIPNSSIPAFGGIGSSSVLRPFSSPHAGF